MSVMGLFFVVIASIALLWLARQGVMGSPWLEEGEIVGAAPRAGAASPPSAAKVGLGVFLAVAGCLFSLLTAAFFIRMGASDWWTPPLPKILWLNTAVLIASSVALQWAQFAAKRDDFEGMRALLLAGGVCAVLFLAGQLWAWREMIALRYYAASNAANAFFYLLTGTHALHLAGGLVALARTTDKALVAGKGSQAATSVELCAIYWHFLLLVWLLLFAMLAGAMDGFGAICRAILS
jgi:cytochrome c oxidase subunit 3